MVMLKYQQRTKIMIFLSLILIAISSQGVLSVDIKKLYYEKDISEYCKRRVIPSIFLGRHVVEASSSILHFTKLTLPYSCYISIRAESGSNLIMALMISNVEALEQSCSSHSPQLLVYEIGETFGGYWGMLPEVIMKPQPPQKTKYYTLKTTQSTTTTTESTTVKTDPTTSQSTFEVEEESPDFIEVPIVEASGHIEPGSEPPTSPFDAAEAFDYLYDVTPIPGVKYDTIILPLVQLSVENETDIGVRDDDGSGSDYELEVTEEKFTPDPRLTLPRFTPNTKHRIEVNRLIKFKKTKVMKNNRRKNFRTQAKVSRNNNYIFPTKTNMDRDKVTPNSWEIVDTLIKKLRYNNVTGIIQDGINENQQNDDRNISKVAENIWNLKHNYSIYLQHNLSVYDIATTKLTSKPKITLLPLRNRVTPTKIHTVLMKDIKSVIKDYKESQNVDFTDIMKTIAASSQYSSPNFNYTTAPIKNMSLKANVLNTTEMENHSKIISQTESNDIRAIRHTNSRKMSMVEVDPKLFIKCRLCLEESGTYQIVPSVRDQIGYCFEINVEPFDGLPQLICKKCQSILSDYSKIKKSFNEKQDLLKKRTLVNNGLQETEQDKPAAAKHENSVKVIHHEEKEQEKPAPVVEHENSHAVSKNVNKRRKTSNASSHSGSSEGNNLPPAKMKRKDNDWVKEYQKTFSCRLCSSEWATKKSALNHKIRHKNLKQKHSDILKRYCVVQLEKFDNKQNITGSTDQVVYSKHKIIGKGDSEYYISYKYKGNSTNGETDIESDENGSRISKSSDSSSTTTNELRKIRRRRRRRISSKSSTETVVLKNNSERESKDLDCINIDDTDSDDDKINSLKINKKNLANAKMQAVSKLINATFNKYQKRHEKLDKSSIEQLNRKIISIGRQIINKRGFNCTRLIKYIEHLNLNVIWLSRPPTNVTKNTNFLKIIPRFRYATEKNANEFDGYMKVYDSPIANRKGPHNMTTVQNNDKENANEVGQETSTITSNIAETSQSLIQQFHETTLQPTTIGNGESVQKISLDLNTYHETRKLLNANPVANPRKLPKKFVNEIKKDKIQPEINMYDIAAEVTSADEINIQMPIITFTTSLAPQASNETTSNHNENTGHNPNNEILQPVPRIKVKSVSELMSKETLSRMQTQQQQIPQKDADLVTNNGEGQERPQIQKIQSVSNNQITDDYIILDTIDLPNTRTKSPFQYFTTLLQVHNLTLLETSTPLTAEFNTLIKFKVLYKQETKDEPVILCLSLFCAQNKFCLKIKDRNEININMSKISANWQWEILKIYRGDVVGKVLINAQKIGQDVYDNTNKFLCLLKSIKFIGP